MKVFKGILPIVLILLAGAGAVFAGGNKETAAAPEKAVLNVQVETAISTMDFHGSSEGNALGAMSLIGAGLHYLDGNDVIQLGLAESYTRSPDGLTLTYKIREAQWSDGSPLTAHDFVYAWRRLADPVTAAEYRWLVTTAAIENANEVLSGEKPLDALGVRAADDRTLIVSLSSPVAFVDGLFSFPAFYPLKQSFVEAQGAKFATSPETLLSIGAFKAVIYEPNAEVVEVAKNPLFYRAGEIKLDGIRLQTIKDLQQAALAYQSGIIDIIPRLSGEQIDLYRDDPEFKTQLGGFVYYLTPNQKDNTFLANINVRRALAVSIDREALVKNILRDSSVAAEYLVPRGLATAPDDHTDFRDGGAGVGDEIHFNRAAAQRYWDQAKAELGFSSLTLDLICEDAEFAQSISQFIQAQLQNLPGLTIHISPMPKKNQIDRYLAADFELVLHRWGGDYRDPLTYMDTWLSDQHPVYRNKDYDAVVISAGRGELARDLPKRFRELRRMEQVLLRDVATIPLFQSGNSVLQKANISGVEYHGVQGGTTYIRAEKHPTGSGR
jgi:oligopeptide transport system substrate-binding protein